MGGKPNKGTSKDMRLSRNNPNAGKKGATQSKPGQGGLKKLNTTD